MVRKSVDLSSTLEISIEDDSDGQQDKQAFLGKCKDESIELEDPLKQSPHRKFPLRSLRVKAKTDANSQNESGFGWLESPDGVSEDENPQRGFQVEDNVGDALLALPECPVNIAKMLPLAKGHCKDEDITKSQRSSFFERKRLELIASPMENVCVTSNGHRETEHEMGNQETAVSVQTLPSVTDEYDDDSPATPGCEGLSLLCPSDVGIQNNVINSSDESCLAVTKDGTKLQGSQVEREKHPGINNQRIDIRPAYCQPDSIVVDTMQVLYDLVQEVTLCISSTEIEKGSASEHAKKTCLIIVNSPKTPVIESTNRYDLALEDDVNFDCRSKALHLESSRLDDSTSDAGDVNRSNSYLFLDRKNLAVDEGSGDLSLERTISISSGSDTSSSFFDEDEHEVDPDGPLWRQNFLGQCVLLVEKRFQKAYANTCIKPLCAQFNNVYEVTNDADRLPTSELDIHQNIMVMSDSQVTHRHPFTQQETKQLVCNFINMATAFRMRFPYLLAGIQTGLETKKDIFVFSEFKDEHRVFAKLCFGLAKRRVLECITQLRLVLESDLVTDDARELELLVNRLFTGFGPEWPTIARITGISQTAIKDILIQTNNMNIREPTPWFVVHECLLKEKRFVPRPSRHSPLPEVPRQPQSFSLHTTMSCLSKSTLRNSNKTRSNVNNRSVPIQQLCGMSKLRDVCIAKHKRTTNCLHQDMKTNEKQPSRVPLLQAMDRNRKKAEQDVLTGPSDQNLNANRNTATGILVNATPRPKDHLNCEMDTQKQTILTGACKSEPTSISDQVIVRELVLPVTEIKPVPLQTDSTLAQRSVSRLKHLLENNKISTTVPSSSRPPVAKQLGTPMGFTKESHHLSVAVMSHAVSSPVQQELSVPVVLLKSPKRLGKRSHQIAELDGTPAREEPTRKVRRISLWRDETAGFSNDNENVSLSRPNQFVA
ncbi:uncharacterized protein LOC111272705 isoform X2 [Varroa jacobsoni]|nr:uncharacterized protein LOC111272705 isoform X2 [Varroa jacobsoni]XP_022710018.1 uncharacterized protein LOC111272705 isoform X2 [Varroa jacobsoni]